MLLWHCQPHVFPFGPKVTLTYRSKLQEFGQDPMIAIVIGADSCLEKGWMVLHAKVRCVCTLLTAMRFVKVRNTQERRKALGTRNNHGVHVTDELQDTFHE